MKINRLAWQLPLIVIITILAIWLSEQLGVRWLSWLFFAKGSLAGILLITMVIANTGKNSCPLL